MLVLLPPSEGKAAPGTGEPLDMAWLSLPGLTAARERVLQALVSLCAVGDRDHALRVLGLRPGRAGEVERNARLREIPAMPAGQVYTGVLYEALGLDSLDAAAHRLASESLLIFSGLWGALRIADRIPPYRCSIGVTLPPLGRLAAYWRVQMAEVMPEVAASGLVLDLRSSAYAAAWRPSGEVAGRTAAVRVLLERTVEGLRRRSVVSHSNKATKGRLVRDLLTAGARPEHPAELVEALRELKYTVEEHRPPAAGRPWELDVVVTEV